MYTFMYCLLCVNQETKRVHVFKCGAMFNKSSCEIETVKKQKTKKTRRVIVDVRLNFFFLRLLFSYINIHELKTAILSLCIGI